MIRTSLLAFLLTTASFAETKAEPKKMELLPLSTTDNKAATSQPKIEEIKAETKADDAKKEASSDVKEPAKVESISADGSVKLAEAKPAETATETKQAEPKHDDDKAFEAKAVEPGDLPAGDAKVIETSAPSSFSTTQQADIETLVLKAIEKNPDVLVKAIQSYSETQQKEALKKEAEKMTKFKDDLLDDKTAVVGGNPNGNVKLVVFADPNCPHCRHFEANLNDVKGLYSNLKVYMRPWPIMGNESADTVTGLMAAAKQGYDKYESLIMRIATSNEKVDKVKFLKMAKELGLDMKKLQKSMDSDEIRKEIKSNHELAVKIGLDATPTIIMFDGAETQILMPGDKDSLKKSLTDAKA
ncbi:MAG: thioredoxin domain-containing protein [Candidatus Paracaedibacteraceae bacterium]|nr:thioredoxin domain-containing protein [Candidatus Paracaedibacteraceae bacterium]